MINPDTLRVAGIQCHLHWENRKLNHNHLEKVLVNLENKPADLVILPEMFTTGFTMNASQFAEEVEGETLIWMRKQALRWDTAITGSVIVKERDEYFNRLYFVRPDGKYEIYDKRHTFSYAGENEVFSNGQKRIVVDYKGWKICPLICYDLRFPVWSRNTEEFDLLIYVANWPHSRIQAWDTLLAARAIENLCFTIGVNRVGVDGSQINYSGHTTICDPLGSLITMAKDGKEEIVTAALVKRDLEDIRNQYHFLNDQDEFVFTNK